MNSMRHLRLFASVCCLLLAAIGCRANKEENEFLSASAELQSVNAYLTGFDGEQLSTNPSIVIEHLNEARSLLATAGDEIIRNGLAGEGEEAAAYRPNAKCLFGNDPSSLREIIDSLAEASSESCDQTGLNFLALVKSQTFGGQFLNSYAEQLINSCTERHLNKLASRLESSLSKAGAHLFELVADLAHAWAARYKKMTTPRGQIVISDGVRSGGSSGGGGGDEAELARILKQLKLEATSELTLFATVIRNYYAETFKSDDTSAAPLSAQERRHRLRDFFSASLEQPCVALIGRWSASLKSPPEAAASSVQISTRQIAETIELRRKSSPHLDGAIELVRICKQIRKNSAPILAAVGQ